MPDAGSIRNKAILMYLFRWGENGQRHRRQSTVNNKKLPDGQKQQIIDQVHYRRLDKRLKRTDSIL